MGRLGLIVGSSLRGERIPAGDWELFQRHGETAAYVLPHRIDHVANLRALSGAGCDRLLAIGSVGGLRPELGPGTIVCPATIRGSTSSRHCSGRATSSRPPCCAGWRSVSTWCR